MLQRFNDLSPKDRIMYVAAVLLGTALYFMLFILPLTGRIEREKKKSQMLAQNATTINKSIAEYRSLPSVKKIKHTRSLLSMLESIAADSSVSKNIGYLKPFSARKGLEGAELKINNVSGKELIIFIHKVQEQDINITKASLKDSDLDGKWNVRLFMEG